MANPLPPVPYKVQITASNGFLSNPWAAWFREAFARIGGSLALTIPDLVAMADELKQEILDLQDKVSEINSELNGGGDNLNQGPVL